MKLTLYRKFLTAQSTIGELHVNGAFFCFTLEDCLRHGPKVYGQTAIPAGTYDVVINYSNRFKVQMPLLINVSGFEGVRVHPGNTPENTLGCILVGRKRGYNWISESKPAYQALFAELQKASSKEKIQIEIINPPGWGKTAPSEVLPISPAITKQIQPAPMQLSAPNDEFGTLAMDPTTATQRLGHWVDTLDGNRLIGVLSLIATVTAGLSAAVGNFNPKYAATLMLLSGAISAFTGRIQGLKKENQ